MPQKERHILSLSGGKDSTALAIYLRDRVPDMEYIFHDTDKELPDTIEYLKRLEAYLGVPIERTTEHTSFDKMLRVYGGMLPSNHRRWCTRMLKLKPFEDYVGDDPVVNYVGLRADEDRTGYISHKPNITVVYPFQDDGIVYEDVIRILEESGLGMPPYTEWGRTHSGCFFCFYQQKIEWVRLKQKYPELYEEAKAYEKPNKINGNVFYWNQDESLEELEQPERIAEIIANWEKTQERLKTKRKNRPLVSVLAGYESEDEEDKAVSCAFCKTMNETELHDFDQQDLDQRLKAMKAHTSTRTVIMSSNLWAEFTTFTDSHVMELELCALSKGIVRTVYPSDEHGVYTFTIAPGVARTSITLSGKLRRQSISNDVARHAFLTYFSREKVV